LRCSNRPCAMYKTQIAWLRTNT